MKYILFSLLFSLSFWLIAQKQSISAAQNELKRRGEVYFRFNVPDKSQLTEVSKKISIDKLDTTGIYAYANEKGFHAFLNKNIPFELLTAPSEVSQVEMTHDLKNALSWNYYPTYEMYETLMQKFASDYPDICRLITIGTLASGHKLLALKISKNPDIQENEPEFYYSSTMHGDETTGYIMLLRLIDYLTSNYGSNHRVSHLVDNMEIYICPLQNPDGTYRNGNHTVNGATRYNAQSIDLNRNYPDARAGAHPDDNAWQEETLLMIRFYENHHFTMSANFHGGVELINYPWDTWTKLSADDAWWRYIAREYADTAQYYSPTGYFNDENNGITNGAAWYVITGGQQDYTNYFTQCRESTVELSTTKLVATGNLESYWNYNYRSLLNYMEQATFGLRGVVADSAIGLPLAAKIERLSADMDSSMVFSELPVGNYHRMLKAGNYTVTFSADGYVSKTFSVNIADKKTTLLNVQLTPTADAIQTPKENPISIFPNPIQSGGNIEINSPFTIKYIQIFDIMGKPVFRYSYYTQKAVVPAHLPAGVYYLTILTIEGAYNKKVIIH